MTHEPMTVGRVAEIVGGAVEGDASVTVEAIAAVDRAGPRDLTFADARHAAALADSGAGAAICQPGRPEAARMALIRVDDVPQAVFRVLTALAGPEDLPPAGVHPTAIVAPDASVGPGAAIGPGAVVGRGAKVGDRSVLCAHVRVGPRVRVGRDCVLFEGVVVRAEARIGDRVRIGPNSVIGFEGYGYQVIDGVHRRVPHVGSVVIEDDVEIGACTCVDRAKFGATRIGAGTKIDNLVQVAHNCQVGAGSLLIGQAGLAGSVRLGRGCVVGGHAGLRDNIALGDGAQVASYTGVSRDVPAGEQVAGTPAMPAREAFRIFQAWRRLPGLLKRVRALESRLESGESSEDD
jgi:UDP-3-O-[3-hydroxymyristoyl] glucosamine N-acyltransferase